MLLSHTALLSSEQNKQLERLSFIKAAVEAFREKQDTLHKFELISAAGKGDNETVSNLLKQGLSANLCDYDKRTCLHVAAQDGHLVSPSARACCFLLHHLIRPLHLAKACVEHLVKAGGDVNAVDVFGTNVLFGAVMFGHDDVVEFLLTHGATLKGCEPVVIEMANSIVSGDLAVLARFLRSGADPNVTFFDTRTPLHVAAAEGSLAAVKLLLAAGADVLKVDRWGHTALDDAKASRSQPVIEFLEPIVDAVRAAAWVLYVT